MLALTQPNDIHSLAMLHPVLDWVGLDEAATAQVPSTPPKKRISSTGPLSASEIATANALLQVRRKIFRVPGAYFEPQASPMHFVRAPGRDTPLNHDLPEQVQHILKNEERSPVVDAFGPYDDDLDSLSEQDSIASADPTRFTSTAISSSKSTLNIQRLMKRRKVLQRWPPVGVNITDPESTNLPYMSLFSSSPSSKLMNEAKDSQVDSHIDKNALNSLLGRQSREFVQLAQRACFSRMEAKARLHLQTAQKEDVAKQVAQWFASLPP